MSRPPDKRAFTSLNYRPEDALLFNARMVKFILNLEPEDQYGLNSEQKKEGLKEFLRGVNTSILLECYKAAISDDKYYEMPQYAEAFRWLEAELVGRGSLNPEELNKFHQRIVPFVVTKNRDGQFIDGISKMDRSEVVKKYSLMKHGSNREIKFFSEVIADYVIFMIKQNEQGLQDYFLKIKELGHEVICLVPGARNVKSSSNIVMEDAIKTINTFLALNDLPTVIVVSAIRFGDSADLLPDKQFFSKPIHVLLADNIRMTGQSSDSAKRALLDSGAKSVRQIFTMMVSPDLAFSEVGVEEEINTAYVSGQLDDQMIEVFQQSHFFPVQRLIRTLLSQQNRATFTEFIETKVSNEVLMQIYASALGNNFLKSPEFKESVEILTEVMAKKGLIDIDGVLQKRNKM